MISSLVALCATALFAATVAPLSFVEGQLTPGQAVTVDLVFQNAGFPTDTESCATEVADPNPAVVDPAPCQFLGAQMKVTVDPIFMTVNFTRGRLNTFTPADFNGVQLVISAQATAFTSASLFSQYGFSASPIVTFTPQNVKLNLAGLTATFPAQAVVQYLNRPGSGAFGDPQISGFLGQSFQVHGTANTVYSVISSAKLQYNALFTFLSQGKCRSGTECFAHPGNYFGKVGVQIAQASGAVAKVEVTAGPVDEGMKVTIDGEPLTPSDKHIKIDDENSLHFSSPFELLLQTRDYTLRLENSDMFLNQQVSIRQPLLAQISAFRAKAVTDVTQLPHGILGQTWRRMSYPNRWVHLEGDLMNYIVADGLLGVPQEMNRFKSA